MRLGSLFSGIGGLELGLERAGLGHTVYQVEADPFCRAVLAAHWPHAQRFDDVRLVGADTLPAADLLCGGFPCQDVSSAGKRAGLDGARSGLWHHFARIASETRPTWIVVENVASGARRWLPFVRRDLWTRGYDSVPLGIAAAEVGARHRRERIFVVGRLADPHRIGWPETAEQTGSGEHRKGRRPEAGRCAPPDPGRARLEDGQGEPGDPRPVAGSPAVGDGGEGLSPGFGLPPRPALVRGVHGLPGGLDGPWRAAGWTPARVREARIRALGNSVVPACAEWVGRWLMSWIAQSGSAT